MNWFREIDFSRFSKNNDVTFDPRAFLDKAIFTGGCRRLNRAFVYRFETHLSMQQSRADRYRFVSFR